MLANARFGLFAGALVIGTLSQGCAAPTGSSPQFVHARAEVVGGPSATTPMTKRAAIRPMDDSEGAGVQIVELNGYYQGCMDLAGPWSVAVNGADIQLDNPALMVVQNDVNCQLIATEVRADQLYEATSPQQLSVWDPSQASQFTALDSDGGSPQVAFYASGTNTDPGFSGDFTLVLFYSAGANDMTTAMSATYSTSSASVVSDQIPAPDYGVDLSQIEIQTDANQVVMETSGQATFYLNYQSGTGYVIDDGTLPENPTFGQLDAMYTSQSPTLVQGSYFQVDASTFDLQGYQLPLVRNVIIAGGWTNSVTSYQVMSITFNGATDLTSDAKRVLTTIRK
jgi:hypothetical protein